MTYEEIASMVEEIGLPCTYDHFAEGESPKPPFVVFVLGESDNFIADGRVYAQVTEVGIELYTDLKLPNVEHQVEAVLDAHEIPWDKYEQWITTEKLFEVRYSFDVLYEWEDEDMESEDDDGENDGKQP